MALPQQLQQLFYLKEKFLYEILKNVQAIQQLMGGWLYDNGERFKTWIETFILITKLWDLWQVLIDVFDDYEESCAVCHKTDAMGAPAVGAKAVWAKAMEKGMDKVNHNAINGIGGMPPKGGAMNLSDDEVKDIVKYMVESSK